MRVLPAWLLVVLLTLTGSIRAQSPVIGMNNFIHATEDLQKTVAFYKEVFGLPQPPPPRPPNPAVPGLVNAPGAQLQVAIFRFPGATFGFELTYFGGIERKGAQAWPTDPGAAQLILRVPDLGTVLAAVQKNGAPMLTRSNQSLTFRDPDGFLVEVEEGTGAAIGITVSDMTATLKFYRDLLGFELAPIAPAGSPLRQMAGNIPGAMARIEFYEYKGVDRTPFHLRVPDPGCPALALRVTDLDGLLQRMKVAGVKVVSAGGVPAQFSPTIRNIFVEDPDGFKIELYQSQ